MDCQPRTKKGQPVHSTTGSDSTSSTQVWVFHVEPSQTVAEHGQDRDHHGERQRPPEAALKILQLMLSSASSGMMGSSDMPHLGQLPG
jgi:hypothetical protein